MSENQDLLPPDAPRWTVITVFVKQTAAERERGLKTISHHELLYGGRTIEKATGERELEKLRTIAAFSNKHGHEPRAAIQCAADDSGPIESRLRKQTKRAEAARRKDSSVSAQ